MPAIALVKDDRYKEHLAGEGHPESPNRLSVIHDLIEREFSDLPLITPRLATVEELGLVHDHTYIQMVARTEGVPFSRIDMDTGLSARSYETARLAAGGLLAAVDRIQAGTTDGAFAFVRPPGHHAEPQIGMGFCLFNNVAIAAAYAKKAYGLKRILIVDWDLHHGNGTQRAFYNDPSVLFFSSHQYPHYPGTGRVDEVGHGDGKGYTVNAPLPSGFGDNDYRYLYETILMPIGLEYQPELVLVSAGFDPYIDDPLGGMQLTGDGFAALAAIVNRVARTCCSGKVLMTLEGGYNPDGLRNGTRSVLQALNESTGLMKEGEPPTGVAEKVREHVASAHRTFWKSLR